MGIAENIFLEHEGTVVVVIPAFNEERFIASVVLTAKQFVHHVIVVDDGSYDRTAQLAEACGAIVLKQEENRGKGEALNTGFRYALQNLNPVVTVMLDADAQHDPAEIPEVIAPILSSKAEVVIGSRFVGTKSRIPWWRQIGQHTLTAVTNAASGVSLTDSQSGFRAFSASALRKLVFRSSGLAVESEMQFLLHSENIRVLEVPIRVSYLDGNKRNPVSHGIQVIDAILSLVAERRPLLFFGVPGGLCFLMGLITGSLVVRIVENEHILPVGTAIICSLLLLAGIVLSITGIILHSLDAFTSRLDSKLQHQLERLGERWQQPPETFANEKLVVGGHRK